MHLCDIARRQADFDREHGWSTDTTDTASLIAGLQKDVVGLVGEIGEFANELQKLDRVNEKHISDEQHASLSEELVDAFVYLLRLANRLNVDLETVYDEKMAKNEVRFERFRR